MTGPCPAWCDDHESGAGMDYHRSSERVVDDCTLFLVGPQDPEVPADKGGVFFIDEHEVMPSWPLSPDEARQEIVHWQAAGRYAVAAALAHAVAEFTSDSDRYPTCPWWCAPHGGLGLGDHWANPGDDAWPAVHYGTAYPDGESGRIMPAPTWGQGDGLAPAVLLWIQQQGSEDHGPSIDLTPDAAEQLAVQLIAAATAARNTTDLEARA